MHRSLDAALFQRRTQWAFLSTYLCNAPFWALYNLLVFILYKDLHATPFQIALFIALKPIVSLFSVHWSHFINKRRDRLVSNVIFGGLLGRLPFFLFPFIDNPWFFIFSGALYMMMHRGVVPAWMELLKLNLPAEKREKLFSYGSTISYVGMTLLPLLIGTWLDNIPTLWRWLFPIAAALSSLAIIFQARMLIAQPSSTLAAPPPPSKLSFWQQLQQPWKNAWQLLRKHRDFASFQAGFMAGGAGLILMQPALPVYFVDVLDLSYTQMSLALSVCKGLGFALTSSLWATWMRKFNLYRLTSAVTLIASLFPIALVVATSNLAWLYIAYLLYGIMQAGSELSWHLSGPIFSKNEESSAFSQVNIIAVGLRGCLIPALGSALCALMPASNVLLLGGLFCLVASLHLIFAGRRFPTPVTP